MTNGVTGACSSNLPICPRLTLRVVLAGKYILRDLCSDEHVLFLFHATACPNRRTLW